MAESSKMQDIIRTSLESIRAMVDANTVVGKPIETPSGTTIIPISKVSVGYASGGLDSDEQNAGGARHPKFLGGGGTGLSVQPVCFLAVDAAGGVELLPLGGGEPDTVEQIADLIEKTPALITRFKALFRRRRHKVDDDAFDAVAEDAAEAAAKAEGETDTAE